jgi:four helix bundle protein
MSIDDAMAQWERTVPTEITSDALWRNAAYRLATFAADTMWPDVTRLAADSRTVDMANQISSAVGSIGANYAEGYSRGTDRDRCRIYEYSLGSAREARDWCYKARHVLGTERTSELLSLLTRIVQLLTVTIVRERSRNSRFDAQPTPEHKQRRRPIKDSDDRRKT